MTKLTPGADAVVMAAAVADFRPADAGRHEDQEAGRPGAGAAARWCRTRTSWSGIAAPGPGSPAVVVGFAAETGDEHGSVLDYARDKLARKGCDLLVVNRVDGGRAFEVADNAGVILSADGSAPVADPVRPENGARRVRCATPSPRRLEPRGERPE